MTDTFLIAQGFLPGDLPFVKWEWASYLRANTVPSVLTALGVVVVLTLIIKPLVDKIPFFAADKNRSLLLVPFLIAIPIAFMAEYSREAARYAVAVRRVMANGMGAAVLLFFIRVFFHGANSSYRPDPDPSLTGRAREAKV